MINGLGSLGFTYRRKNFLSWAIWTWCKIFRKTKSKCAHTFGFIDDLNLVIMEATEKGLMRASISKYTNDKNVNMRIYENSDLTRQEQEFIAGFVISNEGATYDIPGFLSFIWSWIPQIKEWFYCSEIWDIAYREAGHPIFPERKEERISPAEMEDWIKKQENWMKIFEKGC